MKRMHWLPLIGISSVLILCFWLVVCGSGGFVMWHVAQALPAPSDDLYPPTPPPMDVHPDAPRPDAAERYTAQQIASAVLPPRDLPALAHRLQGLPLPLPTPTPGAPPEYDIGDTQVFWLHNIQENFYYTTTAVLRAKTEHAYWWVEEGSSVREESLQDSARVFEEQTYPTNRRVFGSEWTPGIDGDPRVYIFLGDVPGVGGYFSGPDEYPRQVRPHSNQHEMFYINLRNARPGNDYFDGILAHEFQHMIHWWMDRDEDTWVNEGLSELASQINGLDVGSTDLLFAQQPDTQLTTWPDLEDSGPYYGASYLFLAYFFERYGEEAIRRLVAEPANGIAGFEAVLDALDAEEPSFDDLFADWVIANYLDADGELGYAALDVEAPHPTAVHRHFPVQARGTVHQYAADYIVLEGEGELTVTFNGSPRVSLLGNAPHSGRYQWWALRGDEGDATLTRAFDLRGLDTATLRVWMWYDLEDEYDYAYVEVSTDGGMTWQILSNEHTTTDNPSGNAYGPGFTGLSGGGEEATWSLETFDLTPYAGEQVQIRFEVVTDEAVNHPGLAIDDIAVPELGYFHDAESGADGWQAEGWLRVTRWIPQDFIVQVITFEPEPRVRRMSLNADRYGTMTIGGQERDVNRAVLVIAALAPATTSPAVYEYRVENR